MYNVIETKRERISFIVNIHVIINKLSVIMKRRIQLYCVLLLGGVWMLLYTNLTFTTRVSRCLLQEGVAENLPHRLMGRDFLTCDNCSYHRFNFIVNFKNVCSSSDSLAQRRIEIITLIPSTQDNVEKRRALRDTWLKDWRGNKKNVRYVFLLGLTDNNAKLPERLKWEISTYKDIVLADFMDTYRNLTLKTLMAYQWSNEYCPQAEFVFKVDDDMFVNLHNLLRLVFAYGNELQTAVGGACSFEIEPDRNKESKWYVSWDDYSSPTYPGYCSGTGYITSKNVVRKILQISKNVPYIFLEDVYIGFCVARLGFSLIKFSGFHSSKVEPVNCEYFSDLTLITSHNVTVTEIRQLWGLNCGKNSSATQIGLT